MLWYKAEFSGKEIQESLSLKALKKYDKAIELALVLQISNKEIILELLINRLKTLTKESVWENLLNKTRDILLGLGNQIDWEKSDNYKYLQELVIKTDI